VEAALPPHEVKAVDLAEVALGTGQDPETDLVPADQVQERDQVQELAQVLEERDQEAQIDQERGQVQQQDQAQEQGLERDQAQELDQVHQDPAKNLVQEHVRAHNAQVPKKEVEVLKDQEVLRNQDLNEVALVLGKDLVLNEVVHLLPLDLHQGVQAQNPGQDKEAEKDQVVRDPSPVHKKHPAPQRPPAVEAETDQAVQNQALKVQAQEVEALQVLPETLNLQGKVKDQSHPKIPKVQGVQRALVVPSLLVNPSPLLLLNHQKNRSNKKRNQKEKEKRRRNVLLRRRMTTNTPVLKKRRTKKFPV